MDMADEIAYNNHDLDDGITSGLINRDDLNKIGIWKNAINSELTVIESKTRLITI